MGWGGASGLLNRAVTHAAPSGRASPGKPTRLIFAAHPQGRPQYQSIVDLGGGARGLGSLWTTRPCCGQAPPSTPPNLIQHRPLNPSHPSEPPNPTQEGLLDSAICPTDRNWNLAVTPGRDQRLGPKDAAQPDPRPWPACPALPAFPRSWLHVRLVLVRQGCRRHRGATRRRSALDTPPPTVTTIKKSGQINDQPKTTTPKTNQARPARSLPDAGAGQVKKDDASCPQAAANPVAARSKIE
jgi:hypothetical protein